MRKLAACETCQFNARSNYLVCAVHPQGIAEETCLDYRRDRNSELELWAPVGYRFEQDNLIPVSQSSVDEFDDQNQVSVYAIELEEAHPILTGHCPKCGYGFTVRPSVHWDCPECHWKDDSV